MELDNTDLVSSFAFGKASVFKYLIGADLGHPISDKLHGTLGLESGLAICRQ